MSATGDRKADIRVAARMFTTPIIATTTYLDSFGNRCRRLVAPCGDLTIWGDATIEDDGKIDPANFSAVEVPVAELPDSCLLYLMGSRYCETDRLSQTAWDLFGRIPSGWGRVRFHPSACQVRLYAGALDANRVRSLRGGLECAAISLLSQ